MRTEVFKTAISTDLLIALSSLHKGDIKLLFSYIKKLFPQRGTFELTLKSPSDKLFISSVVNAAGKIQSFKAEVNEFTLNYSLELDSKQYEGEVLDDLMKFKEEFERLYYCV